MQCSVSDDKIFFMIKKDFSFSYHLNEYFLILSVLVTKLIKHMKVRRFKKGAVNHVYQRTINRFNIFYDIADYIVYFTIFCTFAKQADITVWGLCLMIDHIHCLIQCNEMMSMSDFVSRVTSVFVRRYNKCRKRVGPLFDDRFGSAPKADLKKLISSIIYVGNNPVERRICTRAEEYRWNFLAYAVSNHPFSEKIDFKNISKSLSRSIRIVNSYLKRGLYLDYPVVDNIFTDLNRLEREQLIDYIICKYNVIDYKSILSHFDSYKQMLVSMRSTTGSEYDLQEDTDRLSDAVYVNLIREIRKMGIDDLRGVVCLGVDDKIRVAEIFQRNTGVSKYQIRKFLHL